MKYQQYMNNLELMRKFQTARADAATYLRELERHTAFQKNLKKFGPTPVFAHLYSPYINTAAIYTEGDHNSALYRQAYYCMCTENFTDMVKGGFQKVVDALMWLYNKLRDVIGFFRKSNTNKVAAIEQIDKHILAKMDKIEASQFDTLRSDFYDRAQFFELLTVVGDWITWIASDQALMYNDILDHLQQAPQGTTGFNVPPDTIKKHKNMLAVMGWKIDSQVNRIATVDPSIKPIPDSLTNLGWNVLHFRNASTALKGVYAKIPPLDTSIKKEQADATTLLKKADPSNQQEIARLTRLQHTVAMKGQVLLKLIEQIDLIQTRYVTTCKSLKVTGQIRTNNGTS